MIQTTRLVIRPFHPTDAPFVQTLFTDPDFLRYIGDRGVRTEADALRFIELKPITNGLGPWCVTRRDSGEAVGISTLYQRDWLDDVDLGFAFLPTARRQGLAHEAAGATMQFARDELRIRRLVAITSLDNYPSIKLLQQLGFGFRQIIAGPGGEEVRLFDTDLASTDDAA